jgi:signal transduction histidine kinase
VERTSPINIIIPCCSGIWIHSKNTSKYSPKHSKVEVGIIPETGSYTLFVKDEGPGIPEQEQVNLFNPFFTTSIKPRNSEKSTGLGLWIVNMLVDIHGGKVWIDSVVGRGTVIYFSIPV